MNTSSLLYLGGKRLIGLQRTGSANLHSADNRTVLAIQAQRQFNKTSRGSTDSKLTGTGGEVNATQADKLAIIDIEDIHILLACRIRHILDDTGILDTHLSSLQTITPVHGLSLNTLIGVQPLNLLQRFLVQPVWNLRNGAIGIIRNLLCRHRTTLVMDIGIQMHQVIVLAKHIRVSLIVANARMVTTVALCGTHDIVLPLPRTHGRVAHGIAQCLWAASRGISQIVFTITLIEPRTFLIVLHLPGSLLAP